jgi:lambda repressor-like predicted transcriptional regulator
MQPIEPGPRKRHRVRNGLLGIAALFVLLIVVSEITGNDQKSGDASTLHHAVASASSDSSGTSASSPLTSGQAAFVSAIRSALSAHGDMNTGTNPQLAKLGNDVCNAREAGDSQATLITATKGSWAKFDMTAARFVKTAERDICPSEYETPQTITYVVTGSSADVTYGPAGSNLSGSVPMSVTAPLGSPAFYSIDAQLNGNGEVQCEIEINGQVISSGTATGSYNIASCEISQDPITGQWQSDDS